MLETMLTNDQVIKLIRTVAQALGGALTVLLVRAGIDIDEGALLAVIYPLCVGLWVILVDLGSRYIHPAFEKLNVISKVPTYDEVA